MKKKSIAYSVNVGLLLFGALAIFSGLLIQFQYHMGNHENATVDIYTFGMNYSSWSTIHKISIVMLFVLAINHFMLHWKWYQAIASKKLWKKNSETITLTLIFTIVAITGFIPWIISLLYSDNSIRKTFIEIHDKIAIILTIYLIIHVLKRFKWFFVLLRKC